MCVHFQLLVLVCSGVRSDDYEKLVDREVRAAIQRMQAAEEAKQQGLRTWRLPESLKVCYQGFTATSNLQGHVASPSDSKPACGQPIHSSLSWHPCAGAIAILDNASAMRPCQSILAVGHFNLHAQPLSRCTAFSPSKSEAVDIQHVRHSDGKQCVADAVPAKGQDKRGCAEGDAAGKGAVARWPAIPGAALQATSGTVPCFISRHMRASSAHQTSTHDITVTLVLSLVCGVIMRHVPPNIRLETSVTMISCVLVWFPEDAARCHPSILTYAAAFTTLYDATIHAGHREMDNYCQCVVVVHLSVAYC